MNKKMIAAAIAAAVVAAPAAFAESVVYGKFHTSIDAVDHDEPGTANDIDNYKVENRSSRLGFKGSEDLGGGLKAIYQIEFGIRSDGGDAQSAGDGHTTQRNTFVGLAGDWGTVLVGRHDTPAKMAFYASGNDRLGDSIIDLNTGGANPIGVFSEFRVNNVIAYISPSFSGFSLAAAVVPGEESGASRFDADGISDHVSFGAMYSGYGLKASVAYEEIEYQAFSGPVLGQNQEMIQAGASYTFNNISVGVQYENSDNYQAVNNEEFEAWGLTAKATFGNNAISAVYTIAELDNAAGAQIADFDGWGIAAEHNFSKRTKAYVAYASGEDDGAAAAGDEEEEDRFSLGMIHNF
jgi:predicted porin